MKRLFITVTLCVLVSCSVTGNTLQWENEDMYKKEALKKTQIGNKRHPLFQCPDMSPSPSVPTSVEFVKPADIKVIAALGDSLTAASGANAMSAFDLLLEFRHLSWSIGGHRTCQDVITLPNIFKLFNPDIIGASSGQTYIKMNSHVKTTGFNLAVSGDRAFHLPTQTQLLIDKLRHYEGLNFKEDWKLLTILIGMNDICNYCKYKALYSANNYILHITHSLEMLMEKVPRMIVNVVQIMPMQILREVKKPAAGCLLLRFLCPCLMNLKSKSPELQELVEVNLEYQKRLENLLNSDRFFKEDFAVVLQPFMKHAELPRQPNGKIDMTYFSPDCFHLSVKGHEELAKGLWNNMFEPVGNKTTGRNFSDPISLTCPPAVNSCRTNACWLSISFQAFAVLNTGCISVLTRSPGPTFLI